MARKSGIGRRALYRGVVSLVGEATLYREIAEYRRLAARSPEAVSAEQRQLLAAILRHAREASPWYRDRVPSDAAGTLASFPILSKTDLQEGLTRLLASPEPGRVTRKVTGGSTGQAVTVIKDRQASARERAAMWFAYGWFGIGIADPVARLWGAPFATRRRWVTRAGDFVMNRIRFSAFAFTDADLERYWRRCVEFRPSWFHGYVSMLEEFARYVVRRGYDGTTIGVRSIVATSEALSEPQRQVISQAFGAPVQSEYGCGELGPIAYECPEKRFHVMARNVFVEFLDATGAPVGPGESGRIIVTDLANRAMPLIRYEIGDNAVVGAAACPCGRPFPVIDKVWGRAYDFVDGPDGKRYHGEFFMYLFEDLRREGLAFRQFKVIQTDRTGLRILVVPVAEPAPAVLDAVRARVGGALPGYRVDAEFATEIPRSASGKAAVIENRIVRPAS